MNTGKLSKLEHFEKDEKVLYMFLKPTVFFFDICGLEVQNYSANEMSCSAAS